MSKTTKDGSIEQLMPGCNFSPGNITLFEIAESHGKKLGQPQQEPADVIVSDRDKEILSKAIPADKFENVLRSVAAQVEQRKITLNKVMKHKPTGKAVKVIKLNVGKSRHGSVQHMIKVEGSSVTCKVKEENLCPI
jgi:F0F1-type ATP synthase delta subunit